jgi:hypothetical protein
MMIKLELPADVGENDVIAGGRTKVNPGALAEPPCVVTETIPEEPEAIIATIKVPSVDTVKL